MLSRPRRKGKIGRTSMSGFWSSSIGFAAGLLTTAANVPQILKTYKTKSAEGLSFRMILTLAVGLLLWVVYGVTASSLPIIASNSVALLLILALLAMKLKFDRSPAKD